MTYPEERREEHRPLVAPDRKPGASEGLARAASGFGGLLMVIVVAGIDALVMLREVRDSNVEIRRAYLVRNRTLEQIRSGIYLSGTTARDYLLAISPAEADQQRAKFRAIQADTNAAVASYARSIEPEEAAVSAVCRARSIPTGGCWN